MFLLLSKFGTPPKFVNTIECMHKNMKILLKIGTTKSQLGQRVGAHYGDCLAPLRIGMIMMAFGLLHEQDRANRNMSNFLEEVAAALVTEDS